jgi:hypothetical protein
MKLVDISIALVILPLLAIVRQAGVPQFRGSSVALGSESRETIATNTAIAKIAMA